MELVFAYAAGLLTLINPCVLPILPIILGSALQADRRGPIALAAGMGVTFVILGVTLSAIGPAFGLYSEDIAPFAAALMVAFGLVLLSPRLGAAFATATAGVSNHGGAALDRVDGDSVRGQFLTGALLGAVWSPCVGPTLGGAILIASEAAASETGGIVWSDLLWATAIMTSFAIGVATVIIGLSVGARETIRARAQSLRGLAENAKPIMGGILVALGLAIMLGLHHRLDAWLNAVLPSWLIDASVAL